MVLAMTMVLVGHDRGHQGARFASPHRRRVERRAPQRPGVRLGGRGEHVRGRARFDDPPAAHHHHLGADLADHAEVVGDDDVREVLFGLEFAQQLEHLGLYGDVQRGRGLVADQQVGPAGQGAGDADPLALAAGELGGAPLECAGGQAHLVDQLGGPAAALGGGPRPGQPQRLGHDLLGGQMRVQGSVRVLEDHLHPAPQRPQPPLGQRRDVGAVEQDRAPRWGAAAGRWRGRWWTCRSRTRRRWRARRRARR